MPRYTPPSGSQALHSYTQATLPAPSTAADALVYVSDAPASGSPLAYSDGTAWHYLPSSGGGGGGAVVSVIRSNAPAADQWYYLGSLPDPNSLSHMTVELHGGEYGLPQQAVRVRMSGFGVRADGRVQYVCERLGARNTGFGVIAFRNQSGPAGTVEVYALAQANRFVFGTVTGSLAVNTSVSSGSSTPLVAGPASTTVPVYGSVAFSTFDEAAFPNTAAPAAAPPRLLDPGAPALTFGGGGAGTLVLGDSAVTVATPYTVGYRMTYLWTPSATGSATAFMLGNPAGLALQMMSVTAFDNTNAHMVGVTTQAAVLGRMFVDNVLSTNQISISIYALFAVA